ncbi:MAG: hypothetical protein ACI8TQ_001557 [Planctomycetota bacterium]|jgi:hypothetical protein
MIAQLFPLVFVLCLAPGCGFTKDVDPSELGVQLPILELEHPGDGQAIDLVVEQVLSLPFEITDLRIGPSSTSGARLLIACGWAGFAIVDESEERMSIVSNGTFEDPPELPYKTQWDVRARDLDGDGRHEFVVFPASWHGPIYCFDSDGQFRWKGIEFGSPNYTIDFDYDLDGRAEFLVGSNQGLTLYGGDSNVIWNSPLRTNAEGVVLDRGSENNLIAVATDRGLSFVSKDGELQRSFEIPGFDSGSRSAFYNEVALAENVPGFSNPLVLIGAYLTSASKTAQFTAVYDAETDSLKAVDRGLMAPFVESERLTGARGNWLIQASVEMEQGAVAGFKSSKLRVSVYTESGTRVFERVLKSGTVSSKYALLLDEEAFLVGYGKQLWRFQFDEG